MKPDWLDTEEYPFESKYIQVDGGLMHYVDEGVGKPIVMVHGTPSWSFLYRNLIKMLRENYRCIAMDMLGFGLSDKPENWSYKPRAHADNFEQLVEHLQLEDITLLVHDFGAPVGLAYAIKHPQKVTNLVMLNSWTWSLCTHQTFTKASKYLVGPLGRFMLTKLNVSTETLVNELFGEMEELSEPIKQQYVQALGRPGDYVKRLACARELVGSSNWYEELWKQRKVIQDMPTLILWGGRDKLVKVAALQHWRKFFHECYVIYFEDGGHFLQEQNATDLAHYIDNFIEEEQKKLQPIYHP